MTSPAELADIRGLVEERLEILEGVVEDAGPDYEPIDEFEEKIAPIPDLTSDSSEGPS